MWIFRTLSIILFVLIWEIVALFVGVPYLLPRPVDVAFSFIELLISPGPSGAEWAGELMGHTLISLVRVVAGFGISVLSGMVLGIAMGWWRFVRNLIEPIFELLRPVPPLAWIPLAMLWFGLGFKPSIFLIWLGAFAPVLLNTITGVESTSATLIEVARTLGAKNRQLLVKVVIPSAIPSILVGIKVGFGVGWMCLVAAELTGSTSGLGYMIVYYQWVMQPAKTIVGMVMIGIIGVLTSIGLSKLENSLLFWRGRIR
jgi:NitT/TauT family transport system permease protein